MPNALHTHVDFRSASDADLLALFFPPARTAPGAMPDLHEILGRVPRTQAERRLHAGVELARRALFASTIGKALTSPAHTGEYLCQHFLGRHSEVFRVVRSASAAGEKTTFQPGCLPAPLAGK